MLKIDLDITILVAMQPVDMRCSIDKLIAHVIQVFGKSPQEKSIFIFHNKNRDKVKGLLWHGNGFLMLYKRIEKDHFRFPKRFHENSLSISHDQLYGLLNGFDFVKMQNYPGLNFSYYF